MFHGIVVRQVGLAVRGTEIVASRTRGEHLPPTSISSSAREMCLQAGRGRVMADICVIYNPKAGRGVAARSIAGLKRSLGDRAEFQPTHAAGHAEELAALAAVRGFPFVAAVGGDGTVHEVANGLLSAPAPGPTLAVMPAGSANDYAFSLQL